MGVGDELLVPERAAIDGERMEAPRVEPVRAHDERAPVDPEQTLRALDLRPGEHEQPPAPRRPAAHPPLPRKRVPPRGRRALVDPLEHQQFGAVEVADHRHSGRDPLRGLVERGEVVQVQHVRLGGAGSLERPRPGGDVHLVGLVVHGGEDRVRRVGTVLVGRVLRRVPGGEVHRHDVQPLVEGASVPPPRP